MWNRQREAEEARETLALAGEDDAAPNRMPPRLEDSRAADDGRRCRHPRRCGVSMSIVASVRSQLVPINHEGYPFIAGFAIASLFLMWLWSPLGWLGVIATLWCVYFFRDPPRVTPLREGLVISPADGRVSRIANAVPPPSSRSATGRWCASRSS